jgi:hypothetical protein
MNRLLDEDSIESSANKFWLLGFSCWVSKSAAIFPGFHLKLLNRKQIMLKKWFRMLALGVTVGVMVVGANILWQQTAAARPSDNAKDIKKGEKPVSPEDQAKGREAKIVPVIRARQWREKLDAPITIEFEPNTPLREALSHIAERYGLTILVDKEAFQTIQNQPDIEAQPVKLPRLVGVKLVTALRAVFQQVGGDFYTKDDVLMVVPRAYIENGQAFKHSVDVSFSKRPLANALAELSYLSGVSVVLDPRGQQDSKLDVTADFSNVPVQDAVRVLANIAGMKSVAMSSLLYVTSVENADNLEEEAAQKRGMAPAKSEKVMPQEKK